jgi:tRNA threonylcarbamoyladenosine dehydratase
MQGVGSHAAHLLLRSGVGRLRLVDFDQVTLSSLNRHCLATRADVGLPKATCLSVRFKDILPEAQVEPIVQMYNDDTEDLILSGRPDFVLDAIDNIETKVSLLAACKRRGIPVLAVAGAGAKADPTRVKFVDVAESAVDPLARAVRQRLRRDHNIDGGITVLLSTEKPRCGLVYGGEEGSNPADYQVIPNFRIRTIPVLGTTPAGFGLAAAGWILCHLAGSPIVPEPHFRGPPAKEIQTQYDRLEARERERAELAGPASTQAWDERGGFCGADMQEIEILIRELWRGRSARSRVPPATEMALTRGLGGLALTRWDPSLPATVDNLVLLTREEADVHDAETAQPHGFEALCEREPEFAARVYAVLQRARQEFVCSYY